ncbi:MAG: hypothetical protein E4G96_05260 [Chrysiogenales bacterium]|nr:MAG: hypothetical protein E4G96_05260 [Chrysiogenales bacterium]
MSHSTLLKTEKGLVRLLAWTAINRIFNSRFSRIKFQSGYSRINQNSVIELTGRISGFFPGGEVHLKNEYFLKPPFNIANMIIVNFGIENAEEVRTVHHLYQTSWGESYIDEYSAAEDLVSILGTIVSEGAISGRGFDESCMIVTPEPFKKHYKEIEQTFRDAYEFITKSGDRTALRCIVRLGNRIVTITRQGDQVSVGVDADFARCLTRISLHPLDDVVYSSFGSDPRLQALAEIFRIRKRNSITAVYEENGKRLFLHLVNERDNIFTFIKRSDEKENTLIFLLEFLKNVMRRMRGADGQRRINESIRILELAFDRFGKASFEDRTRRAEETYLVKFKSRKGVTARIARNTGTETRYAIAVQGGALSRCMSLKGVPGYLMSLRASDRSLIPMITDVEFIDVGAEVERLGSTHYLLEKYRIELMIDIIEKQTIRPGSYRERT